MKQTYLVPLLSLTTMLGCGPAESTVPRNDAGIPFNDAGHPSGKPCEGICVSDTPGGWTKPVLLWTGDEAKAPLCSEVTGAPLESYTGHADPSEGPFVCGACSCDPPTGSCHLPAALTASSLVCGAGEGTLTSFDPPPSWDGSCTAANPIAAGELCGSVPCVQSVTVASLTPTDKCKPIAAPVPGQSPRTWKTFARACANSTYPPPCTTGGELCVASIPGSEFKQCIFQRGDPALSALMCPPAYPDRSVFYSGAAPMCTPCACSNPIGSTCTGSITLFSDAACGVPLSTRMLDALGPKCGDLPLGSALGSKSAISPSYSPGKCTATGGATMSEPSPYEATVFCCQP